MSYLFSLIIPCHNPEKTIFRLFDSLTRQHIPSDDLEIIVVDDNSDNLEYREQIKQHYSFNLRFVETSTDIHCPSNTRRKGMEFVTGDWVFFCDQDDYFEDNALAEVKKYILDSDHKIYVISTIMKAYNEQTDKCHTEFAHKQAWIHGKWYSMKNLIIPYGINFKEDLVTHEDIYFNSFVLAILYQLDCDWDYFDLFTYRWVDNPESITRKPTNDRGYLFENFNDYLVAAGEPFWAVAKATGHPIFINQIMMTLLHAYFYYEAVSYYCGATDYVDIVEDIHNYIRRIVDELNFTLDDIVNFLYVDPYKYEAVKDDCACYSGQFIPKTSCRDFIYRVGKE